MTATTYCDISSRKDEDIELGLVACTCASSYSRHLRGQHEHTVFCDDAIFVYGLNAVPAQRQIGAMQRCEIVCVKDNPPATQFYSHMSARELCLQALELTIRRYQDVVILCRCSVENVFLRSL